MAKEINEKLEKLIENKYGSLSDYAKKIGIEPSYLINLLGSTRVNQRQLSSLKQRDFGPIGLDVDGIIDGKRGRKIVGREVIPNLIPLFRRGTTPQNFELIRGERLSQFALDGDGGPKIYCRFATHLSSGEYGVFLKKGTFMAGFFLNEDSPLIYPDTKFNIPTEITVTFKPSSVFPNVHNDPKSKLKQITPKDENAKPIEITPFSGITVFGRRNPPFVSGITKFTIVDSGGRRGPIK